MKLKSGLGKREVEKLGHSWVIDELRHVGIEAVRPEYDKLVDLMAWKVGSDSSRAVPLQVIALSSRAFSVNRKYSGVAGLLLVHVWNLQSVESVEAYAMTYAEAVEIAHKMEWTKTLSWQRGYYVSNSPSEELLRLLEPFRMTPAKWLERIKG